MRGWSCTCYHKATMTITQSQPQRTHKSTLKKHMTGQTETERETERCIHVEKKAHTTFLWYANIFYVQKTQMIYYISQNVQYTTRLLFTGQCIPQCNALNLMKWTESYIRSQFLKTPKNLNWSFVAVRFKAIFKLTFSIHTENKQSFSFRKNGQTILMPHLILNI